MADNELLLPHVSYETLNNIIHAYGSYKGKEGVNPEYVGKVAGIDKTVVSRSSKFLTSAGVLQGGRQKTLTEQGTSLAIAIGIMDENEIEREWREICFLSPTIQRIIHNVKINEPNQEKLIGIIQRNFNIVKPNKFDKTGIRTIKDLLFKSGIFEEKNGQVVVSTIESSSSKKESKKPEDTSQDKKTQATDYAEEKEQSEYKGKTISHLANNLANTTININLQLSLPETNNPEIYDNIFSSMKKHLLTSDD